MEEFMKNNPTLRRWGGGILMAGLIAFNKKLGLDLQMEEVIAITTIAVSLITGSNLKEAKVEAAKIAAERTNTDVKVVAELTKLGEDK